MFERLEKLTASQIAALISIPTTAILTGFFNMIFVSSAGSIQGAIMVALTYLLALIILTLFFSITYCHPLGFGAALWGCVYMLAYYLSYDDQSSNYRYIKYVAICSGVLWMIGSSFGQMIQIAKDTKQREESLIEK